MLGAIALLLVVAGVGGAIWIERRTAPPPAVGGPPASAPPESGTRPVEPAQVQVPVSPPSQNVTAPPAQGTPVGVAKSAGRPAATAPKVVSTSTGPSAAKTSPSANPIAEVRPVAAAAPALVASTRLIKVSCKYEFESATLLLLSGDARLYEVRLIGKKKRGFIGLKGKGFAGATSEDVTIPGDARELTVRVYSDDGSVNVLGKISGQPPSPESTILSITPSPQHLALAWVKSAPAAK